LPLYDRISLDGDDAELGPSDVAEETLDLPPRERRRADRAARRGNRQPLFRDSVENPEAPVESALSDATDKDGVYRMSYKPARYEGVWLTASLRSFFEQELIVDVLAQVKGGKEANVYRCQAHPRLGVELLAAKVYRPRQFRNLRNDALYREGRPLLTASGSAIPRRDRRSQLAVAKKTAFGAKLQHTSWLMHEYLTLDRLYRAGVAVPRPFASNENCILMTYYGDDQRAAPTLNEVRLPTRNAAPLFQDVLHNVDLMLGLGLVHGDLSAYNLLYWEGKLVLIDFPQGISSQANQSAPFILRRDVQRICEYFARQGVTSDLETIVTELSLRHDLRG